MTLVFLRFTVLQQLARHSRGPVTHHSSTERQTAYVSPPSLAEWDYFNQLPLLWRYPGFASLWPVTVTHWKWKALKSHPTVLEHERKLSRLTPHAVIPVWHRVLSLSKKRRKGLAKKKIQMLLMLKFSFFGFMCKLAAATAVSFLIFSSSHSASHLSLFSCFYFSIFLFLFIYIKHVTVLSSNL